MALVRKIKILKILEGWSCYAIYSYIYMAIMASYILQKHDFALQKTLCMHTMLLLTDFQVYMPHYIDILTFHVYTALASYYYIWTILYVYIYITICKFILTLASYIVHIVPFLQQLPFSFFSQGKNTPDLAGIEPGTSACITQAKAKGSSHWTVVPFLWKPTF